LEATSENCWGPYVWLGFAANRGCRWSTIFAVWIATRRIAFCWRRRVHSREHKTLVLFGPPVGGRGATPDLETLLRKAYPGADFLIPTYSNTFISNASPFEMADVVERSIRGRDDEFNYQNIVLFGYSLGGLVLRKAYIWGHGVENDRNIAQGPHPWANKVDRFVSLAAPNRGWPDKKPANLGAGMYVVACVLWFLARLTGTGKIIQTIQQGSPFVANMRVQWINLFRSPSFQAPLVIHLLGDSDELVDRADSIDLEAGPSGNVTIKTLIGLNHREIGTRIYEGDDHRLTPSGEAIQMALTKARGQFPAYWPDKIGALRTDPNIKHLIFVMHGIRDESTWPAQIQRAIERRAGAGAATIKVVPPLYRRFAMLPFLLYWDRQKNVRWFMDEYTDAKATYPNLEIIDFVGHSNGTYILASALQQYSVLSVRNVLFAGSVVPVHYDWETPIRERRVTGKIWNVCADFDWVVAIFPQIFQQISDWLSIDRPEVGLLDIGSAGFRGFRTSILTAGILTNQKYISGPHGAALETAKPARIDAIADFVTGLASSYPVDAETASERLEIASNLSWAIWSGGLAMIALAGALIYYWLGWSLLTIYLLVVLGLLTTW
jgi:pimeloyl-ACP methyl ester carboxylesterase